MLHKIAITSLVLWVMAATTMPLATPQEAALSEGSDMGLRRAWQNAPTRG
jgi:hypothetical protein